MRDNRSRAGRLPSVLAAAVALTAMQPSAREDPFAVERARMVEQQIARRGVDSPGVLSAMREVPRHLFIPEAFRDRAYFDAPQPIGDEQTISQPYIVALMTSLLELDGDEKVLEIGTGSGYQAAVLSRLVREVYTIEIRDGLAKNARRTLERLGYGNIEYRIGDGYAGWPEAAPFDAIVVTAAPKEIPPTLIEQLKVGGKMVVPVGSFWQDLLVVTKTADGIQRRHVAPVRFVPMVSDPN